MSASIFLLLNGIGDHSIPPHHFDNINVYFTSNAQVKYTGYKDKPHEERKQKFLQDLSEGHTVVV